MIRRPGQAWLTPADVEEQHLTLACADKLKNDREFFDAASRFMEDEAAMSWATWVLMTTPLEPWWHPGKGPWA